MSRLNQSQRDVSVLVEKPFNGGARDVEAAAGQADGLSGCFIQRNEFLTGVGWKEKKTQNT